VETNHQNHDSKSEIELLLQPNAAFIDRNQRKSPKERDKTCKYSLYCSQMQPFIAPKLGEGRVKVRRGYNSQI
jgi:hypothetical protein